MREYLQEALEIFIRQTLEEILQKALVDFKTEFHK